MAVNYESIIDEVSNVNPDAIILDGLDGAIIGASGDVPVFVYSIEACISIMMRENDWDYDTAIEYLDFNTFNTYYGEYGPKFVCQFIDLNYN